MSINYDAVYIDLDTGNRVYLDRPINSPYKQFKYLQNTPALIWTISHQQTSDKFVTVFFDSNGNVINPSKFTMFDSVAVAEFNDPMSGWAIMIFFESDSLQPTPTIIYVTPTPTPSATLTPTITPTPSSTPTVSLTPTLTQSISSSLTPTITPSTSMSASVTPTLTPSISVSPSLTPTITPTPSVGSTDPYFSDVVSLLHFSGSSGSPMIIDITGRAWTSTNGPAISTTTSEFGGTSLYFANNYSYIESAITSIGTSDFTIEGFVNWAGVTSNFSFFFDYRPLSTNGIYPCVYIGTNGTVHYFVNNGDQIASTTALTSNTWYHVALSRSGGVTRLFINGVQAGANYTDTNNYLGSNLRVGGSGFDPNSGVQFGYLDEFRVTYGYGRYSANFTPPTMPFPNQ